MAYSFIIDGMLLPVAPSKVQIKIANRNKTITLIDEGEVNILKEAGLKDIEFEALLPNTKYPFATYIDGFQPAKYFLDKLEDLKSARKPFQFIISRVSPKGELLFDDNMKVSLEEYIITDDVKNGLDIVVSIKLRQYKEFGTKRLVVTQVVGQSTNNLSGANTTVVSVEKTREVSKSIPKNHTVVTGDTLWAICKKYLGDGSKYPEIAKLNGIANPNLIYPGQVIKLE